MLRDKHQILIKIFYKRLDLLKVMKIRSRPLHTYRLAVRHLQLNDKQHFLYEDHVEQRSLLPIYMVELVNLLLYTYQWQ